MSRKRHRHGTNWRDLPVTSRQAAFIARIADERDYDVPTLMTRGDASDFIAEYLVEYPEARAQVGRSSRPQQRSAQPVQLRRHNRMGRPVT